LAIAAGKQADATKIIAENSRRSASTAERTFAANRPTVNVDNVLIDTVCRSQRLPL
jgi:hypothetical protein